MRECDFCGTPATDENATTCQVCGSPLAGSAPAAPAAPEPFADFDPGATIASPRTFAGLAAEPAAAAAQDEPGLGPLAEAAPPDFATVAANEPRDDGPVPYESNATVGGPRETEPPAGTDGGSWIVETAPRVAIGRATCGRCGHENDATMAFCTECGARLGEAAAPAAVVDEPGAATVLVPARPANEDVPERTVAFGGSPSSIACTVCGSENDAEGAFCVECGARLGAGGGGPEAAGSGFAASGVGAPADDYDPASAPTVVPEQREPAGPASRSTASRTPSIRCRTCGALNDAIAAVCASCGTSFRVTEAEAPPAPPPPVSEFARADTSAPPPPAAIVPDPPTAVAPLPPPPAPEYLSAETVAGPIPIPPPPPAVESETVTCASCGAQNDQGTRFCVSCGSALARDSFGSSPAAVPPPPPLVPDPPARSQDPFARSSAPPPPQAPPASAHDPFATAVPAPAPPPVPAYPPPLMPDPPATGGGSRVPVLIVVGIVAGAGIGAAIAFAAMAALGVGPF